MKRRGDLFQSTIVMILVYAAVVFLTLLPWFGHYKYMDSTIGARCIGKEIYILSFVCFGIGLFLKIKEARYSRIFLFVSGLLFMIGEIRAFFSWDAMDYHQGFLGLIGSGYYWMSCFNRTLIGFYLCLCFSIVFCIVSCRQKCGRDNMTENKL